MESHTHALKSQSHFIISLLSISWIAIPLGASPLFLDSYTKIKWTLLDLTALALLGHFIFFSNHLLIPSNKKTIASLMLLPIILMIRILFDFSPECFEALIAFVCIAVVTYAIYFILRIRDGAPRFLVLSNILALGIVTLMGYLQLFGIDFFLKDLGRNEFPASTFGFQNMTAEFVGFSFIFAFIYINSIKRLRVPVAILLIASIVYLYILKSRTSMCALIIATGVTSHLIYSFKSNFRILHAILFAMALIFSITLPIGLNPSIKNAKSANVQIRKKRWKNTIEMIRDHPLGVGLGRFQYSYFDYHSKRDFDPESTETMIVKSPHNTFLGIAAEGGVSICALVLILIGLALYWSYIEMRLILYLNNIEMTRRIRLFISGSLFFLIDSFFNFPLELAYTCFAISVVIGFGFSIVIKNNCFVKSSSLIKTPIFAVFIGLLYLTITYTYSEYVFANQMTNINSVKRGCKFFPSNLFVCTQAASLENYFGRYYEAISSSSALLSREPHWYPALKIRGDSYLAIGDRHKACLDYNKYNSIFDDNSSIVPTIIKYCF